jgi:hypothetical protein
MIILPIDALNSTFGMLAQIDRVPSGTGVQERHDRVSDKAEAMLSILDVSNPLLLVCMIIALFAAWKKYLLLSDDYVVGTVLGTTTMVGQPVGLPTEKKVEQGLTDKIMSLNRVITESGETTVVDVSAASPKVSMPAKDRLTVPAGCGMVELQNSSGEESAFEMVMLLYQKQAIHDGLARSLRLQKKLRDNGSEDRMIVYVPEADLLDLKEVWSSREMQEGRKNVMKDTKQRAPRLSFFRNDGSKAE